MRSPNLFLIGTQKGGSSSLFRALISHPEIGKLRGKEPNIFNAPTPEEAQRRLAECTPKPEMAGRRWLLDASVNYSRYPKYPTVPETIHALSLDPAGLRFIYILRNPVERMVSNYFWKAQLYGTPAGFEATVAEDPQFVQTGLYDRQIEHYLRHFDRSQFRFLKSETYMADSQAQLKALFGWLGLDPEVSLPEPARRGATDKETTRQPRSALLSRTLRAVPGLRSVIRSLLPDETIRKASRAMTAEAPRQDPPAALKQALIDRHFQDSIRRTAELTGLDLDDWLVARPEAAPSEARS
jgi:hypothetical protein